MISQNAIGAVILDWDELIAKSEAFFEYSTNAILLQRGLPSGHELYMRHFSGRRLTEGIKSYLKEVGQPIELLEELRTAKRAFDGKYEEWITPPHKDALCLIARLRGEYPLAIATGTRRVLLDIGLRKFGIEGAFDALVTAEDYEKGKLAPDSFLIARERVNQARGLSLRPQDFLVFEDSPFGLRAAKAAGMMCVAVTHSHTAYELSGADFILDDLRDFDPDNFTVK